MLLNTELQELVIESIKAFLYIGPNILLDSICEVELYLLHTNLAHIEHERFNKFVRTSFRLRKPFFCLHAEQFFILSRIVVYISNLCLDHRGETSYHGVEKHVSLVDLFL